MRDIQPDKCGIDRLGVSSDIEKCGAKGFVSDDEHDRQRENRHTTPHLTLMFFVFSIFSFAYFR